MEDSFEVPDFSVETQDALNRVREEVARLSPAIRETVHAEAEKVQQEATRCRDAQKRLQDSQQKMQDRDAETAAEIAARVVWKVDHNLTSSAGESDGLPTLCNQRQVTKVTAAMGMELALFTANGQIP